MCLWVSALIVNLLFREVKQCFQLALTSLDIFREQIKAACGRLPTRSLSANTWIRLGECVGDVKHLDQIIMQHQL